MEVDASKEKNVEEYQQQQNFTHNGAQSSCDERKPQRTMDGNHIERQCNRSTDKRNPKKSLAQHNFTLFVETNTKISMATVLGDSVVVQPMSATRFYSPRLNFSLLA